MKHELPRLPYPSDALIPVITKNTIEYHYGKHHQAYVNNLNSLISGTPFENMSLEEIIKKSDGGIFNNAAQVFNHTFYFSSFRPGGSNLPKGSLSAAIDAKWGSFDNFKKEFANAAATLFGSGWSWLVKNEKGELSIIKENNAGCPLTSGLVPILTFDVWEHAYYLDYQNRRADYITALWSIVDWEKVASRY
ncbi:MAG: superoxide dismutase [Bacteroidales bacterium]|nr:superoxide dismutase [Bacteroidales bacterium]MDD2425985.1 superoxide dismutase [Bacteroidales bacterium]MDD3990220.1 superoxide dismutase [Bacteroidales bacterium]MDD4638895.1 superoxide dismutase [Bacteroidales bacterium]